MIRLMISSSDYEDGQNMNLYFNFIEIIGTRFFKYGSLANFPFFKVECKKQGKSHNAYIQLHMINILSPNSAKNNI